MPSTTQKTHNPCSDCSSRCCVFNEGRVTEAVLSPKEIKKIKLATGRSNFYEKIESGNYGVPYYRFKITTEGCCTFYNSAKGICTIYEVRPIDCRLYPLDFEQVDDDKDGDDNWVVYDCPLSRQLDDEALERMMTNFEENFADEIKAIEYSGSENIIKIESKHPFRMLRKMRSIK